jgi:hypothetical protein
MLNLQNDNKILLNWIGFYYDFYIKYLDSNVLNLIKIVQNL